ncbi:MAG: hypothetical protein N2035_02785 [Chthoniobacterales bacterium]|nr:hypothetical protein [Chthoniobacterales bacterium]MCX7712581.1 hypothetical protein [Chthoniobacterales bacterium]
MSDASLAAEQLRRIFQSARADHRHLMQPLLDLSEESEHLVVGYAAPHTGWNRGEDLIPYYHVLGKPGPTRSMRALLTAGWFGNEESASYTLFRLVAALEEKFQLVDGIEATVYPIVNLDAREAMVVLTPEQRQNELSLWHNSLLRHIQVIEKELLRNTYDIVFRLEEDTKAEEFSALVWPASPNHHRILLNALQKYQTTSPGFEWKIEDFNTPNDGRLTPIPQTSAQPSEILLLLPGQLLAEQQAEEGIGLILSLLHTFRENFQIAEQQSS